MMMKLDSNHTSLAVISLDSALNKDENIIHKNIIHYKSVNTLKKRSFDDLESSPDDSDDYDEEQMFFDEYLSCLLFSLFIINI